MKLLLDECVDQRLRTQIAGHDVFTVGYMGWASVKNGELLRRAADANFAALVTTDRGIRHQHNAATLPLAVVCLHAPSNDFEDVLLLVPRLIEGLIGLTPRMFVDIY